MKSFQEELTMRCNQLLDSRSIEFKYCLIDLFGQILVDHFMDSGLLVFEKNFDPPFLSCVIEGLSFWYEPRQDFDDEWTFSVGVGLEKGINPNIFDIKRLLDKRDV